MTFLWKIVRISLAVVGVLMELAVSFTSDYHVIELGQSDPNFVTPCIIIGTLCLVPQFIHTYKVFRKEYL